jgi:hypothetical protein
VNKDIQKVEEQIKNVTVGLNEWKNTASKSFQNANQHSIKEHRREMDYILEIFKAASLHSIED